jgi:hypothetical protein
MLKGKNQRSWRKKWFNRLSRTNQRSEFLKWKYAKWVGTFQLRNESLARSTGILDAESETQIKIRMQGFSFEYMLRVFLNVAYSFWFQIPSSSRPSADSCDLPFVAIWPARRTPAVVLVTPNFPLFFYSLSPLLSWRLLIFISAFLCACLARFIHCCLFLNRPKESSAHFCYLKPVRRRRLLKKNEGCLNKKCLF